MMGVIFHTAEVEVYREARRRCWSNQCRNVLSWKLWYELIFSLIIDSDGHTEFL